MEGTSWPSPVNRVEVHFIMRRIPAAAVAAALVALVFGLPLAGGLRAGGSVAGFTRFPPPLEIPTDYLRLSWLAVAAVGVLLGAVAWSWMRALSAGGFTANERNERKDRKSQSEHGSLRSLRLILPAWGWLALGWTMVWWALAWTRWTWFAPLQPYTFFPLWLGFILVLNAAVEGRTGSCLMRREPTRWLALFAASAGCWWSFEWLNRFVRNWHYLGAEQFGAGAYFLHATLCFSTVLPAVAAVAEWLDSHPGWRERVACGPRWTGFARRDIAALLVAFGCVSLFATGRWPTWSYPALWVSPLVLALGVSVWLGRPGIAHEMAAGDWRRAATWSVAALVCGFFWELWNWHSVAKWIYTVPGVERWRLFEMPALGYAGYLPFGLECLLVSEWVGVGRRREP